MGLSLMLFQQITGQPSVLYYASQIFADAGFAAGQEASGVAVGLGLFKLLMTGDFPLLLPLLVKPLMTGEFPFLLPLLFKPLMTGVLPLFLPPPSPSRLPSSSPFLLKLLITADLPFLFPSS